MVLLMLIVRFLEKRTAGLPARGEVSRQAGRGVHRLRARLRVAQGAGRL